MAPRKTTILCSQGEPSARAYAVAEPRAPRPEPSAPPERVVYVDPRRTVTRTGPATTSQPRNLEARVWSPPRPPAIEFPDQLPGTCRQPIIIHDPGIFVQWQRQAEANQRGTRGTQRESEP